MKRNERRRMTRKQSLPVEQQKSSTWWEGTVDMVPFPCSSEMTCLHDHTIPEHTLRFTRCPIVTYHSPREDRQSHSQKLASHHHSSYPSRLSDAQDLLPFDR